MENDDLKKYIPDDISPINLSREYLLSVSLPIIYLILLYYVQVLAYVDNKLYLTLYESYKEIKEERLAKKWGEFEVSVMNGVKGILDNFQSVDSNNPKASKPLRLSKNGKEMGFLSKIPQEDKKEKFQELPKKYDPLNIAIQNNEIDFDDNLG